LRTRLCGLLKYRMLRPSSDSPGWQSQDSAPISRPVWKSAGAWPSSIGDTARRQRRPGWRLVMLLGLWRSQKSYLSHPRRTAALERSWNGLGCAAIPPRISIIPPYLRGIHCEGTCFIGSNPGHIPECRQRFQFTADEMQSKPLCGLRMPQPAKAFRAMRQIANIQTAMMVPSVARPLMVQPAA